MQETAFKTCCLGSLTIDFLVLIKQMEFLIFLPPLNYTIDQRKLFDHRELWKCQI